MSVKQNRAPPILPTLQQTPPWSLRDITFGLDLQNQQATLRESWSQRILIEESSRHIVSGIRGIRRVCEDQIELLT